MDIKTKPKSENLIIRSTNPIFGQVRRLIYIYIYINLNIILIFLKKFIVL